MNQNYVCAARLKPRDVFAIEVKRMTEGLPLVINGTEWFSGIVIAVSETEDIGNRHMLNVTALELGDILAIDPRANEATLGVKRLLIWTDHMVKTSVPSRISPASNLKAWAHKESK